MADHRYNELASRTVRDLSFLSRSSHTGMAILHGTIGKISNTMI